MAKLNGADYSQSILKLHVCTPLLGNGKTFTIIDWAYFMNTTRSGLHKMAAGRNVRIGRVALGNGYFKATRPDIMREFTWNKNISNLADKIFHFVREDFGKTLSVTNNCSSTGNKTLG